MHNMTMKYIAILLSLSFLTSFINAAPDVRPDKEKPQIEKPHPKKIFPKHWGHPPQIQTRDMVKLPGKFGEGSSTLSKWITNNLKKDGKPIIVICPPAPKPPTVKPKPPVRPVCPPEVKKKMEDFKVVQKQLQVGLLEKIKGLGKKPTREDVLKAAERYRKENRDAIDSQKELGKTIQEWQKENPPERPKKPEPTAEVKEKIKNL